MYLGSAASSPSFRRSFFTAFHSSQPSPTRSGSHTRRRAGSGSAPGERGPPARTAPLTPWPSTPPPPFAAHSRLPVLPDCGEVEGSSLEHEHPPVGALNGQPRSAGGISSRAGQDVRHCRLLLEQPGSRASGFGWTPAFGCAKLGRVGAGGFSDTSQRKVRSTAPLGPPNWIKSRTFALTLLLDL